MCFDPNEDTKRLRASEDITCFKQVYVDKTTNKITSGVQSREYKMNRTYGSLWKKIRFFFWSTKNRFGGNGQGFHSYINQEMDANVKCIIPKGSLYYGNGHVYFSNSIRLVEIIETGYARRVREEREREAQRAEEKRVLREGKKDGV